MGGAEQGFSYDRVHYPRMLYHVTRPDHLEVMGRLFGMQTREAERARVLEIGCGVGDNLLVAGECFPEARLIGVDLSRSQIEEGLALRKAIGVRNVELVAVDLTRIDASFGEFDYIVAHGVYSWVPEGVREALLELIRQRLAPQGVAFVSHNVKPGWFTKALAREMMLHHTRGVAEPAARVAEARRFIAQAAASVNPEDRLYRAILDDRSRAASERNDDVLFHDDLSEICDGCWFWEMAERLEAHGLQYLVDANTEMLGTTGLAAETIRAVEQQSKSFVDREQNLDFLRNRALRLTLVCHAGVALARELRPEVVVGLHAGLDPQVQEIGLSSPTAAGTVSVRTTSSRMRVEDPLTKNVLVVLAQVWPGSLPFAEVAARVLRGEAPPPLVARLATCLLELFRGGFVALSPRPPTFAASPPERPRACGLARVQAETTGQVANLRHTYSTIEDGDRRVLRALDGSRDRQTLARDLGLEAEDLGAALERLARLALIAVPE